MPEQAAHTQHGLPSVTVDRLVRCHRLCARLKDEGREHILSQEIAECLGCRPSQIRKDFSKLGRLGTRGFGYRIAELENVLGRILGKGRFRNVVLVGAGNLGRALLTYGGFERRGYRFVAVFDADPNKVGTKLGELTVQDVSAIPEAFRLLKLRSPEPEKPDIGMEPDIGIVAVPATGAQGVAGLLAENGVRAILNFAPVVLRLGGDVAVSNVDLAIELEKLGYCLTAAMAGGPGSNLAAL